MLAVLFTAALLVLSSAKSPNQGTKPYSVGPGYLQVFQEWRKERMESGNIFEDAATSLEGIGERNYMKQNLMSNNYLSSEEEEFYQKGRQEYQ
ncbi:hypothetical protein STEG23_008250 [Scotinomys teguina]